jgi:hypothetical protein
MRENRLRLFRPEEWSAGQAFNAPFLAQIHARILDEVRHVSEPGRRQFLFFVQGDKAGLQSPLTAFDRDNTGSRSARGCP